MKRLQLFLLQLLFILGPNLILAQSQLIEINIPAPSLGSSLFENTAEQPIAIYLPPSYATSSFSYPVVYFLPGFSTPIERFLNGHFQGFRLKQSMDNLIGQGTIKEMIVVLVNGLTYMWGSFYTNSPVRGNWEDFVLQDVVTYIDNTYRTLPNQSSRGIGGHSMGGYGCLNLAMLYPEIFSVTYALSPGLFDEEGLSQSYPFATNSAIVNYLGKQTELDSMTREQAHAAFLSFMDSLMAVSDYETIFTYSYGSAFAPDTIRNAPYIEYPYYVAGGDTLIDSTAWKRWDYGFGGWPEKIDIYLNNLLTLKSITIDYGVNDEVQWIPNGCEYVSELFYSAGINHNLLAFIGGHSDKLRQRLQNYMFPHFSETLEFDSLALDISEDDIGFPNDYKLGNFPNPFNPSTTIYFDLPRTSQIVLKIFNSLGQEIKTLISGIQNTGSHTIVWDGRDNSGKSVGSGAYFCTLKAGKKFMKTKKMIFIR